MLYVLLALFFLVLLTLLILVIRYRKVLALKIRQSMFREFYSLRFRRNESRLIYCSIDTKKTFILKPKRRVGSQGGVLYYDTLQDAEREREKMLRLYQISKF